MFRDPEERVYKAVVMLFLFSMFRTMRMALRRKMRNASIIILILVLLFLLLLLIILQAMRPLCVRVLITSSTHASVTGCAGGCISTDQH